MFSSTERGLSLEGGGGLGGRGISGGSGGITGRIQTPGFEDGGGVQETEKDWFLHSPVEKPIDEKMLISNHDKYAPVLISWGLLFAQFAFLNFEQKLIHLPSVYWLTHSSVRLMLLETWQKWKKTYSGQTLASFQVGSDLASAPWRRQQPGSCIEGWYGHWSQKTINLSTVITVRTGWESPTRWEKKFAQDL